MWLSGAHQSGSGICECDINISTVEVDNTARILIGRRLIKLRRIYLANMRTVELNTHLTESVTVPNQNITRHCLELCVHGWDIKASVYAELFSPPGAELAVGRCCCLPVRGRELEARFCMRFADGHRALRMALTRHPSIQQFLTNKLKTVAVQLKAPLGHGCH